jgi:hypothetical protein
MLANKLKAYPVPEIQVSEEHSKHPAVVDFFEWAEKQPRERGNQRNSK